MGKILLLIFVSAFFSACVNSGNIVASLAATGSSGSESTLPVAVADAQTIQYETETGLNLLGNDTGVTLSINSISAGPSHGTATLVAGTIRYTPEAGFLGDDSLSYMISDGEGNLSNAAVVTITVAMCAGTALTNSPFAYGVGTPGSPYGICTATQLNNISDTAVYMDKAFKLYTNIDLSGISFNMIGSAANPFTGVFKGNYLTISNLDITTPSSQVGMFRYISGGTVEHLFLTIGNIAPCATCSSVGAVAGTITNWAAIDDVHVDGTGTSTVYGQHSIGGIIGSATAPGATIANSSVDDIIVSGEGSYVGGIAGYGPVRIFRSNVASTVVVSGQILYTGGVIGRSLEDISETYSLATVNGVSHVGGFVGYLASGTISNCYAKGSVTATGGTEAGGFGGHLDGGTTVEFSYAIGKVAGTTATKGCFAGFSGGATDTANFWINNGDGVTTCNLGASALGNGASVLAMTTTDAGGTAGLIDLYESSWSTTDWYYNVGGYPYLMNNQED